MNKSQLAVLSAIVLTASSANAAPFTCPHTGGAFTFGQEANVNSLDMMMSSAISTRNIAMNVFETLIRVTKTSVPFRNWRTP